MTITKRAAILAVFSGVIAKMAHADSVIAGAPLVPIAQIGGNLTFHAFNEPTTWTVNLDQIKSLELWMGGEKVTITAAELFAALKSP